MYRNTFYATHPKAIDGASNAALREMYLIDDLFAPGEIRLNYVHQERMIVGGAAPVKSALRLPSQDNRAPFLERRELGVINIGTGLGVVSVDGVIHEVGPLDALYIGMGAREVAFRNVAPGPARFYLASTPAHAAHPTQLLSRSAARPLKRGEAEGANERLIYQYIAPQSCGSAQLMMGLTLLKSGNVWNTLPPHTHERRSEVYFYFDMAPDKPLFHIMGRDDETRHIVVRNEQAVICPPWSLHMGVGAAAYAFIWAMGGENLDYDDMQSVDLSQLG